MRYLGGKIKIGKRIGDVLNAIPCTLYIEPFCGSCGVSQHITHPYKILSDYNAYLITMWRALQLGWQPPDRIDEDTYQRYKNSPVVEDPLTAFIAFGCSFAGKWFGGYARSGSRNYAQNARNSLLKRINKLKNATFISLNYVEWSFTKGALIYCDPPYRNTTQYDAVDSFDFDLFWDLMRLWSQQNTVIISEYTAPKDFKCIAQYPTRTDMHTTNKEDNARIECLYVLE